MTARSRGISTVFGPGSWFRVVAALLLMLSLGGGCDDGDGSGGGGASPGTPDAAGRKKVTIGIVAKSESNQVFQAAHAGARDAARELGPKYGVEVVIDIRTPADENAQQQAEAVGALARASAKGIAVSCSDAATLRPAIDDAVAQGVAVMTFDSDSAESKRFCYYGTDDVTCGTKVMQELAKAMGEKGTVAILAGNQAAPNLQDRVRGVREELAQHPGMKELNGPGKGVFYHGETAEEAAEAVNKAQRNNPAIQGWAFVGGWPLFAPNALDWSAGTVKVVSVDALPDQLRYLESGHVEILLSQNCYGWGYESVRLLLDKLVAGKDPASQRIIDPLEAVTKENAAAHAEKWKRWLPAS